MRRCWRRAKADLARALRARSPRRSRARPGSAPSFATRTFTAGAPNSSSTSGAIALGEALEQRMRIGRGERLDALAPRRRSRARRRARPTRTGVATAARCRGRGGSSAAGAAPSRRRRCASTRRRSWMKMRVHGVLESPDCSRFDHASAIAPAMLASARSLVVAAYLIGSISFAVVVSRAFGAARSARVRLRQSGRDQRAAHRQQGRRAADAARRRRSRASSRCSLAQLVGRALGRCRLDGARRRARGVRRPPLPGLPPLRRRQGRRDRGRHRVRAALAARPGAHASCGS